MPSFPKPSTPLVLERKQRKSAQAAVRAAALLSAKRRDGNRCRWPRCQYRQVAQPLDGAHVFQAKGMGGDPTGIRSERKHYMALCRLHHKAQEKHELLVEAQTPALADGPCAFLQQDDDRQPFTVAVELAIGIYRKD